MPAGISTQTRMNHKSFEATLAQSYDRNAIRYRRDDEIEAQTDNHQRLGGNLRRICRSFPYPVRVLEMGCGTGRYFHWLENTALLIGTDISAEMLRLAQHPVHADGVTAREIRLMRANLYEIEFKPGSFDFIYSLGVFGYGAEMTLELCGKIAHWLVPGGRLYFDALEAASPGHIHMLKQSLKSAVLPMLPKALRRRLQKRQDRAVPVFSHTSRHIEGLMESTGFNDFTLSTNTCQSPLWTGLHVECCARKNRAP
jgi:SAM-dependent methyltransferase